ncbi:peptidoglycan-binding domain-containing protein [Streptomyces chromofuscus]|uniref:Peptidoglycan-binding protein n=1 Tax=Streptomyces chromofuscus TaxID=42881 RepID=A0A7M2TEQ7_STRCW|nr:peptidoglycan-binding protein [Streptomyces chromofuscus]QOV46415.1 peptidoglycan-binding protein [Streptomyces chromofuscus]GGS94514.1 peptidoglycan-binding protein [Streptomyces chromofuscus]
MGEQRGHQCPECGAPRAADNTPSCGCGERAAEALRDARTAEQAAAEDFDPLRIRPYVALPATTTETDVPPAEPTIPLPLRIPDPHPTTTVAGAATTDGTNGTNGTDGTDPRDTTGPTGTTGTTRTTKITAITAITELAENAESRGPGGRSRIRRRTALLAASAAVVAVAATAGFAGGLFSYEPPARDSAAPESVREAVPEARTTQPSPTPSTERTSAAPTPRSVSPTPTTTPTPSPTPTASSVSPTPSPTPPQSSSPPAPATGSPVPADRDEPAPTLRRGDSGPEVTELQLRLRQLYLYNDDPHGQYTKQVEHAVRNYQWARGIRDDELGVYGEETRQMLESETSEP